MFLLTLFGKNTVLNNQFIPKNRVLLTASGLLPDVVFYYTVTDYRSLKTEISIDFVLSAIVCPERDCKLLKQETVFPMLQDNICLEYGLVESKLKNLGIEYGSRDALSAALVALTGKLRLENFETRTKASLYIENRAYWVSHPTTRLANKGLLIG